MMRKAFVSVAVSYPTSAALGCAVVSSICCLLLLTPHSQVPQELQDEAEPQKAPMDKGKPHSLSYTIIPY